MTSVNWKFVRDALTELSDREVQERLWMSDGSGGSGVSSFVEAVEQLFTDTGLADSLRSGATGLEKEVEASLLSLKEELRRVDVRHGPIRTINDPIMTQVRRIASDLLGMIPERA